MNTNQLMSRLVSNARRSRPVKDLLPALAIILSCVGCYGSAPQRGPSPVVSCSSDVDCMTGQVCAQVWGLREPVCLTRCNTRISQRCTNGALCMTELSATRREFCMPGAGLPQTFEAEERCRTPAPCVFGESCWFPVRAEVDGMCAPLCADDTECPVGSGCVAGGCRAVCDSRDFESCPDGLICGPYGECQPPEQLADCGWLQPANVPNNCPLGTVCVGSDQEYECASRGLNQSSCGEDEQFFLGTLRCYPRSDLRPL
jgi:hypothetical protein